MQIFTLAEINVIYRTVLNAHKHTLGEQEYIKDWLKFVVYYIRDF